MSQKRLMGLGGTALIFVVGLLAGLTFQRAWTPPQNIIPAAKAAAIADNPATPPVDSSQNHNKTSGNIAATKDDLRETQIVKTVRTVSPSVVTVGSVKRSIVAQPYFNNLYFGHRYYEQHRRLPYMGSGFLIDRDQGFVMTNYHVIEDSERIFVTFPSGLEVDADVIDADHFIDMALLKLKLDDETRAKLPKQLEFGQTEDMMIGERVMAIGNPFGNLIEDSKPTVTVGYVSAIGRSFRPDMENQRVYSNMIQTDAAINPGNSGGPLVNIYGEVVGMNTFIFSPSGGSNGIGFAIPVERLHTFAEEIRVYGRLRPLLMDFDFRSVRSNNMLGVEITDLTAQGPAEKAGLLPRDVILEVDGKPISTREEFYLMFASRQVGDIMQLTLWRQGITETVSYEVEEAPDNARVRGQQI